MVHTLTATTDRVRAAPGMANDDPRVVQPIFTLRETGAYLAVPKSTVHAWARPADHRPPLITVLPRHGAEVTVPFIGFVEAYVLSAFRRAGVPLRRIRHAVEVLSAQIGIEHPLASEDLHGCDDSHLIEHDLRRIVYGADGWASQVSLPIYGRAHVVVDPEVAFGLPLLVDGGARVEDLVDRFLAGDTIGDVADDFGVRVDQVEDVIRAATRHAA